MNLGRTPASCRFICGLMGAVGFGATALASLSNSDLVIVVLQSAEDDFTDAGFAVVEDLVAVAFVAAGLVSAGHTPTTVITTASSGTEAEVSGGVAGFEAPSVGGAGDCAGAGALGAACPKAKVPSRTHSSQLIRIQTSPPGW